MIIIFANESDLSVNAVIEWLIYYNVDYTRTSQVEQLDYSKSSVYWIRKNIAYNPLIKSVFKNNVSLTKEYISEMANRFELLTPNQYSGNEVNKAITEGVDLIMKPKDNVTPIFFKGQKKVNYSTVVDQTILNSLTPEEIDHYIFQELITTDFELRVFFIKSKIYSCALIKRKKSENRIVDLRHEMSVKNILFEKYSLPRDELEKTTKLFQSLNLDFGCVDFLVKDGKYYFLEINQFGQFEEYSKKANLLIEKEIAEQLIKYERENIS